MLARAVLFHEDFPRAKTGRLAPWLLGLAEGCGVVLVGMCPAGACCPIGLRPHRPPLAPSCTPKAAIRALKNEAEQPRRAPGLRQEAKQGGARSLQAEGRAGGMPAALPRRIWRVWGWAGGTRGKEGTSGSNAPGSEKEKRKTKKKKSSPERKSQGVYKEAALKIAGSDFRRP